MSKNVGVNDLSTLAVCVKHGSDIILFNFIKFPLVVSEPMIDANGCDPDAEAVFVIYRIKTALLPPDKEPTCIRKLRKAFSTIRINIREHSDPAVSARPFYFDRGMITMSKADAAMFFLMFRYDGKR